MAADADRTRLHATIAALRYWVPTIADCAQVREARTSGAWTLDVTPNVPGAAAFGLTLRDDGFYDLTIAGVKYAHMKVDALDLFPRLLDAIAAGSVFHRRWTSAATGTWRGSETLIACADNRHWHAVKGDRPPADDRNADAGNGWIAETLAFLPYRR
jgi:hypothetical protein